MPTFDGSKRNPALDGVRGLAILLIVFWHYIPCQLARFCYNLSESTTTGVDLFFVLSGFLIGGILLDHVKAGNLLKVFYLRRVCRIFPLYFGMLAAYALLSRLLPLSPYFQRLFDPAIPRWPFFLFLQNLAGDVRRNFNAQGLSVTWSLAVEEQFYFVMPWLILALSRRALGTVMAVLLVAGLWFRFHTPSILSTVATYCRWDGLAWGVLLALAIRSEKWPQLKARRKWARWAWALVAGFAWFAWPCGLALGPFFTTLHAAAWALFVFLVISNDQGAIGKFLSLRPLVNFGTISYGMYLLHFPILYSLTFFKNGPVIEDRYDVNLALLAGALTWLAATILFRWVETPIIAWGHKFKYAKTG
jgi:peptidoglycan/LPS O-acetylase OafA/YrhL